MFKKLRNKLLLINLVIISVVMFIAFSIIYVITYINVNNENKEYLNRVAFQPLGNIRNPHDEEETEIYDNESKSFNILLNEDGEIEKISSFLDYEDEEYESVTNQIFESEIITGEIVIEDKIWLYQITHLSNYELINSYLDSSEYKISFYDITESKDTLDTLLITFILVGISMLIIIYFISLYFANKSIKQLENMWLKQKTFVADATHELKTPLTIIGANTDLLFLNEAKTIKSQKKWLEYIKSETKSMNKLINELLSSAKAEEEKYTIKNTNLTNLLNEVSLSFETILFEKNIKLKTDIEKNIFKNTDEQKLRQVLVILLDNGIKYNKEEGHIKISLKKENKKIIIKITNTGEGINKEDLPHIFDRFYKSDKSRVKDNTSSYGLGLYIAKTIISKLNGTITVESLPEKETTFIITI